MAKNLLTAYPGKVGSSTPQYPYGEPRDVITNGDGTGTPWQAELIKDVYGLLQAILTEAGIVPSNTADNATSSQYLDGLRDILGQDELLALAPSKAEFLARNKGKYAGSGFVHWGKHNSSGAYDPVNQGIWPVSTFSNAIYMGRGSTNTAGISTTDEAQASINDVLVNLHGLNRSDPDSNPCRIDLPPAPDGLQNIDPTQPDFADLTAAIASGTVNLDNSVINRQDLVLLEVWHEKITDKDVVYPNGLVQYGVTTWEGISLQTGNVAQGYSAFFEGDTTTTGRSAVWSTLSDANKAKFIQDPFNNIYSDNGELIQVRARARVIRGLEGSWIDDGKGSGQLLAFDSGNTYRVRTRGGLDTVQDFTTAGSGNIQKLSETDIGQYNVEGAGTNTAHDGQIQLIPICLVSRLNQGAYHPVHNSQGAGAFWNEDSGDGQNSGTGAAWAKWHEPSITGQSAYTINSLSVCFDKRNTNSARKGDIASNAIGNRPDSGLYDSIQAGQIKDLRIDASGTHTPQTAHHTLSKRARNSEARGWEKLPRIRAAVNSVASVSTGDPFAIRMLSSDPNILGDTSWMPTSSGTPASGWLIIGGVKHKIYQVYNAGSWIYLRSYTLPTGGYPTNGTPIQAVFGDYIDAPYSEGLFQNIIGTPSGIAATFPDGVFGEWIPVIPDGTTKEYKSTKKNLEQYQALLTTDSGATWGNSGVSSENTDNSFNTNQGPAGVRIIPYRAKANFTEETLLNNVEPLYADFVSNFITTSLANHGSILCQSLIGQVSTDTAANNRGALPYSRYFNGFIYSVSTAVAPKTILLLDNEISPSATSDGIQWENTLDSQDGLASLIIPYRQIKHDGTSYGAGLTFNYVDNTSNALDDNGQLIQVGTARSLDDMNIIIKENFNV